MRGAVQRVLAGALVALVALATARAASLVRDPATPRAARERRFFAFAWREPRVAALFAQASRELRPGDPVMVAVAGRDLDHLGYWRGMALYWLPAEHQVTGVVAHGLGVRDLWLRGAWPVRRVPERPAGGAILLCRNRGIEVSRDGGD